MKSCLGKYADMLHLDFCKLFENYIPISLCLEVNMVNMGEKYILQKIMSIKSNVFYCVFWVFFNCVA